MKAAFFVLSLVAATTAPVFTQEAQQPSDGEARIRQMSMADRPSRTYFDEVDGTLWARGDAFKASFSSDGVSFIPFLGSTAPRNFPVTMRVTGVRAGTTQVELATAERATREGEWITLDRGSVTEIYQVTPGYVEQFFRFEKATGPGDLVVRIAVDTELSAARRADGVLEFSNDLGGVRYGTPDVVDATGRRASIESAWDGEAIELRVPEAFLAEAAFPVTIDPKILGFGLSSAAFLAMSTPDVAYDVTTDRYGVVCEEAYSATDHDIFVRTVSAAGATVATEYVDFTSSYWAFPRVANNRIAAQFLAVAVKTLSGGATVIFGRTVQPTNPITMGAQFQISGAELGLKSHPEVGGDPSPLPPTYYCVVWQSTLGTSTNVYYNTVQASSVVQISPSPVLGFSTANSNSKPSISRSDGNGNSGTQDWIVVYQRRVSASNEDVYAAFVHWDGFNTHNGFPIAASSNSETDPAVSSVTDDVGGNRRWMAVYQVLNPGNPPLIQPEYDVWGELFTGFTLNQAANLTPVFGLTGFHDQIHPCVDTDGTRFAVGLTDTGGAVDLGTPYLGTLHVVNGLFPSLGVTEMPVILNGYPGLDDHIRITSKHSGGGPQYRYMTVEDTTSVVVGGVTGITAALYDGLSSAAAGNYISFTHPGCGGVPLSINGFPALGSNLTINLNNVMGTGYIALGPPSPPIMLCTGCVLGIDPATATIIQTTSLTGTIPLDGAFVNLMISVQGADVGTPSGGGCPGPPPIRLSPNYVITIL